jgi:hypothetical protein
MKKNMKTKEIPSPALMMQEERGWWRCISGVVMRVSGRACATCTATAGHRGVEIGKRDILPRGAAVVEVEVRIEWMGRGKNGLHGSGQRSVMDFSSFFHGARLGEPRSRVGGSERKA